MRVKITFEPQSNVGSIDHRRDLWDVQTDWEVEQIRKDFGDPEQLKEMGTFFVFKSELEAGEITKLYCCRGIAFNWKPLFFFSQRLVP